MLNAVVNTPALVSARFVAYAELALNLANDDAAFDDDFEREISSAEFLWVPIEPPPTLVGDMEVFGELNAELLARNITVSMGRSREDKAFQNKSATLEDLLVMLSEFKVGTKDGLCILQGELAGGQRIGKNMVANHILMLDCDTGEPLDDLVRKARAKLPGVMVLVWTTYSNLKSETLVPELGINTFMKKADRTGQPTADDFKEYLAESNCSPHLTLGATD